MSAFDVRDLLRTVAPGGSGGEAAPAPPAGAPVAGTPPTTTVSPVVLIGLVRGAEGAAITALGLGLHVGLSLGLPQGAAASRLLDGLVPAGVALATVGLLQAAGAYRIAAFRSFRRTGLKLALIWTLVLLAAALGPGLAGADDPAGRPRLALYLVGGLALLVTGRFALARWVTAQTRLGRFDRRTAIVGGGPAAESLIAALEAQADSGIRIVGVFDDRGDDRSSDTVAGHPKLGTVADLVAYARRQPLDLIVFTIPITAEGRILQMLHTLWVLPIDIRLSAHATKLRLRPRSYSYLGSVPVLDVFDRPIADWDVVVKAMFDRSVGCLALIALAPVMLGVALAVRLTSPGPVLFRQKRHGFNNEPVEVYKFRSMYVDRCDHGVVRQATRNDPRITPVGRFIRKTSLDELPQLFNVLKGELSLVGPRPHAVEARAANTLFDQVVDGYFARHKVKPGITGWAQINGWRGETDTPEKLQRRVEHDLHYIENWSVLFDLRILAATPFALLKAENAY